MDDNTAQKKRSEILKAAGEWGAFEKKYGASPINRLQFFEWAIAKGVDPTYWWNTRVMAQSLGAHTSSPSQPHQEQVGQPDASGHGGGVVGTAGMVMALLSKEKPELMEDDEEYKKIENNLIKAKGKTKKEDFTTSEELDYFYGSPTDPSKPSLQSEAEKEFREKHPERAKRYDQKKTLVYKNPNEDVAVIRTKKLIEEHTTKRLAYLDKTGAKQDKKNAIKNRIEERTWLSFAKRYPEKAVAYAKDNKQIRIAQTTAQEVEKITQQPPPIVSGFAGPIETPLPFSPSQIPPQPSQQPPPPPTQQQEQGTGTPSVSRAGQAVRNWRAAQAAKKAEGEAAKAIVKKAFWRLPGFWFASGIAGMIILLIVLLFSMGAPFGTGGTGGGTTIVSGGLDYTIPFRDVSVTVTNPSAKDDIRKEFPSAQLQYWDTIISASIANGWNPTFVLTLWIEETGASYYTKTSVGGGGVPAGYNNDGLPYFANGHLGCAPLQDQTIQESLRCLFKNFEIYRTTADFEPFMRRYSSENPTGPFVKNPNFPSRVKRYYEMLVPGGITLLPTQAPIGTQPYTPLPGCVAAKNVVPALDEYSYPGGDYKGWPTTCGPTSATMILQSLGRNISIQEVTQQWREDGARTSDGLFVGSNIDDSLNKRHADILQADYKVVKSAQEIKALIQQTGNAVMTSVYYNNSAVGQGLNKKVISGNTNNGNTPGGISFGGGPGHMIVVYQVCDDRVYINDPIFAEQYSVPVAQFNQAINLSGRGETISVTSKTQPPSTTHLALPASGEVMLCFGATESPYSSGDPHRGIDIANQPGTPIYAAEEGTVVNSGYNQYNGNYVEIYNASTKRTTKYAHLADNSIRVTGEVKRGERIADMDTTGEGQYKPTGHHLHFGVYQNGTLIDPAPLLGISCRKGVKL